MALPPDVLGALSRLLQYNSDAYDSISNPRGLAWPGNITEYPRSLKDFVTVANYTGDMTADIGVVSENIASINTVAARDADIATVAGIEDDVSALAPIAADITTAAASILDIQAAPGAAETASTKADLAAAWAEGHEPGGTGTKSAMEWAQEAGASELAAAGSAASASATATRKSIAMSLIFGA